MESLVDTAKLENLEQVIASASNADYERGGALSEIRAGKLYKSRGFRSFDLYCGEFHGLSPLHAYRLIDLFTVGNRLYPNGYKQEITESHARELKRLPASDQPKAWAEAVRRAGGERVTAKEVGQVVAEFLADADSPQPIVRDTPLSGTTDSLDSLVERGVKYGTIYADPPWRYDNSSTRANVEGIYANTMTVEEICAMPVKELAADNAHLHMWVTAAFLFDGKSVIESWGFEYRTYAVWCKPQIGIGNYWRKSSELLLLGIRGDAKSFAEHTHRDWMEIPRTEHSVKPDQFRGIIEKVSPGPYLELFGRRQIDGWMVFGNQIEEALFPR